MKIHDKLIEVTRAHEGKIFSKQEIEKLVLAYDPYLKSSSILPAEHTSGKRCALCKKSPIFEKLEHGLYKVLPQPSSRHHLSNHEVLWQALQDASNQLLTKAQILAKVRAFSPETHLESIIPTDHMAGQAVCKACKSFPLLEKTGQRGLYKVRNLKLLQSLTRPQILNLDSPESQQHLLTQRLLQFVKKHGRRNLLQSPENLANTLESLFLDAAREGFILGLVLRDQIVRDLLKYADDLPWPLHEKKLAEQLYQHFGIDQDLGRWAINSWGQALELPAALASKALIYPSSQAQPKLQEEAAIFSTLAPERLQIAKKHLQNLQINPTKTGYEALKKGRHRIAMVLYLSQQDSYLLAVKKSYDQAVSKLLAKYATPDKACPVVYLPLFSPQRRRDWPSENFAWYSDLPQALILQAFEILDKLF